MAFGTPKASCLLRCSYFRVFHCQNVPHVYICLCTCTLHCYFLINKCVSFFCRKNHDVISFPYSISPSMLAVLSPHYSLLSLEVLTCSRVHFRGQGGLLIIFPLPPPPPQKFTIIVICTCPHLNLPTCHLTLFGPNPEINPVI